MPLLWIGVSLLFLSMVLTWAMIKIMNANG